MVLLHKTNSFYMLSFGILLATVLLIVHCPQSTEAIPLIGTTIETKRYCSTSLSEVIRAICGGRMNSLSRNYPDVVGNRRQKRSPSEGFFYSPYQSGHECCRSPCSYADLKLYCAPDDD